MADDADRSALHGLRAAPRHADVRTAGEAVKIALYVLAYAAILVVIALFPDARP